MPGAAQGATAATAITVWTPPRLSTVQVGPRRFLRVEVDPEGAFVAGGAVFDTRAHADGATGAQCTVLPAADDAVEVDIGTATVWLRVRTRASRRAEAPVRVGLRAPLSARRVVVKGQGDLWVAVRQDGDGGGVPRAYATLAAAIAEPDHAVVVRPEVGRHDAALVAPDESLVALVVEVLAVEGSPLDPVPAVIAPGLDLEERGRPRPPSRVPAADAPRGPLPSIVPAAPRAHPDR
jgi:hypothetical protein